MNVCNVGCGMSAIVKEGVINIDSSPSVFLGRHKIIFKIVNALGLLNQE